MAWKVVDPVIERTRFVFEHERGVETMAGLCRRFGISRKTGYKWLGRYEREGLEGLKDISSRPGTIPHKTPVEIERLLIQERENHPTWGPKKLVALLKNEYGLDPPAPSTVGDILKRNGLIKPRRRGKSGVYRWPGSLKKARGPNDLWAVDYKGWFRTRDRCKCHPLTVTDQYSRYLLCCRVVERPDYETTSTIIEELFRRVGLPERIRVDNGPPFGCPNAGQLSRLAVDWLKLGVSVEYIDPGRPEQNGRHERMHRTLKEETACPPAYSPSSQQKRFDVWRDEFNTLRPHEALDQVPPSWVWQEPDSKLVGLIPDFEYPGYWETRRVRKRGGIMWAGKLVYISRSFYGTTLGLRPTPDQTWMVYAGPYCLGVIDGQADESLISPSSAPSGT